MKTKNFTQIFNISRESLRNYESSGILHPIRTDNGYREYTFNDLQTMIFHEQLRKAGFLKNERAHFINKSTAGMQTELLNQLIHEENIRITYHKCRIQYFEEKIQQISYAEQFMNTEFEEKSSCFSIIPYTGFTAIFNEDDALFIEIEHSLFQKCLEYSEILNSEIFVKIDNNTLLGRLQFSMKSSYAKQLQDSPFFKAATRSSCDACSTYIYAEQLSTIKTAALDLYQHAIITKKFNPEQLSIVITPVTKLFDMDGFIFKISVLSSLL